MRQIDFEINNYEYKEELKTFVTSINDLMDKYSKSFSNADSGLKKINSNIEKKNNTINKLDDTAVELEKREEELKELKASSNNEIRDLEVKKKSISYTDSEVQKMEIDDLDALIDVRKSKISKIDAKLDSTREKIKTNSDSKKTAVKELATLEKEKDAAEETLYRTNAILKLVETTQISFNDNIRTILENEYVDLDDEKEIEEPVEIKLESSIKPVTDNTSDDDFSVVDLEMEDVDAAELDMSEPTIDIDGITPVEPTQITEEDINEEPIELAEPEVDGEEEVEDPTEEVSIIDFGTLDIPDSMDKTSEDDSTPITDYNALLEDVFNKETISFSDFDKETQEKMIQNPERVIKNVVVLKKHQIPLELTLEQNKVYYDIEPQDLDDLLNIITTDEDGNGMGFTIDFTFYILDELSKINVDKLIDVYNEEFMNINAKSGIIGLLKQTNPDVGEFDKNKKINKDTLTSLGVETVDAIETNYPEFLNLDNPLFLNVLNLFDKDDLVEKLNSDITIVPKILDYWKNN